MTYSIITLLGDGTDPETLNGSLSLLEIISNKYNSSYQIEHHEFSGASVDTFDEPLTEKTLDACKRADAILLSVIDGPRWIDPNNRSEQGLLELRKSLNLFVNTRPATAIEGASSLLPLKEKRIEGADLVIVRELTSGIYSGEPGRFNDHEALDSLTYTRGEIERIVRVTFKLTASRRGKLTSVDKENVLASSELWRKVVNEVNQLYPEVAVNHLLIDACNVHLITNPKQFNVIVCENLFGDILSDEASVIPSLLGLSPSASFSNDGPRLYGPIYGPAPDITDKNVASPFEVILSLAVCLRRSLNRPDVAGELEQHIYSMIEHGQTTADLDGKLSTTDVFEILSQKLNR